MKLGATNRIVAIGLATLTLGFVNENAFSNEVSTFAYPTPARFEAKTKCQAALSPKFDTVKISYAHSPSGEFSPSLSRTQESGRNSETTRMADSILADMLNVHGYTTPEKIKMLTERDRNLAPMRTSYFEFRSDQNEGVGLRIFDASDQVMAAGQAWPEASTTDSTSPIELSHPSYRLPGRDQNTPFFGIEIGLLAKDPNLSKGVETAFGYVADSIDFNYNASEFRFFGRTQKVIDKDMKVWAQTRKATVSLFERYGFAPVVEVTENGDSSPVELSPGMILLSMPANEFIDRYFSKRLFAHRKEGPDMYDQQRFRQDFKDNQIALDQLDKSKMDIRSAQEVMDVQIPLFRALTSLRQRYLQKEDIQQDLTSVMFLYYKLINNIPESLRIPTWANLRITILNSLCQSSPLLGYYYLYTSLHANDGEDTDLVFSPEQEKSFFERFPVDLLPMGVQL